LNNIELSLNQIKILDALQVKQELQVKDLINITGLPRRTILDNIGKLISFDMLTKHGKGKSTFYTKSSTRFCCA